MDPTGPYLEEFLGCATVSNSSASGLFALIILMALMCLKRRWYKTAATVMVLCICLPSPGQAQGFVRAESHASVLSDAPERSVLASTFGVGVRGGYTWGQWRGLAHLERNYWLSTELADRMKAGALNLGFGVEYLSAQGFVRTSAGLGTSTLMFETLLDERGTTGLFFDLRPVELCWMPLDSLGITLTPFSFTYVSPVLDNPPIRMVLYRTILGLEGQF